jgi:hypothetical protein
LVSNDNDKETRLPVLPCTSPRRSSLHPLCREAQCSSAAFFGGSFSQATQAKLVMPLRMAVSLLVFLGARPHLHDHAVRRFSSVAAAVVDGSTSALDGADIPWPTASRFAEKHSRIDKTNCFMLRNIKYYLAGLLWSIAEQLPIYHPVIVLCLQP